MQITQDWQRARRCRSEDDCVEVRIHDGMVQIRNSRAPDGAMVSFTSVEWEVFTSGVKENEFEV